jgi:hypothetical protein
MSGMILMQGVVEACRTSMETNRGASSMIMNHVVHNTTPMP